MTNEFKLFDMKDARLELVNHDRQWVEKHRRVLCVCSAGMLRSATMAWVLSNSPYNFNTRACGVEEFALVRLDEVLYKWADTVVFAQHEHADRAFRLYGKHKDYYVVGVPDNYNYRDPELVKLLEMKFENLELDKTYTVPLAQR